MLDYTCPPISEVNILKFHYYRWDFYLELKNSDISGHKIWTEHEVVWTFAGHFANT